MQIIVNADDLGISATVNDAIFELIAARRVSSATIMANGPSIHAAVAQLQRFPTCSFGVHLNLTQFEPLLGGITAEVLTKGTGQLSRDIEGATPTVALLRAAFDECCAQIDRLTGAGVNITHFDSHHHVHTRAHIFPVLKALQRRYRIRRVRLAKNLYGRDQAFPPALRWKKRAYNLALKTVYRTHTTDVFTEFVTFAALWRERRISFRSVEVMVHPGAANAAHETALLQSDWMHTINSDVELITYQQLM